MAPDAAFEAWLAERVDFAATSLLGLTLRPTFDAGWDARAATDHGAAPAAAPAVAEGAGAELRVVLSEHWLAALDCNHKAHADKATCACSLVDLGWQPNVGSAVDSWIDHVLSLLAARPAPAAAPREGVPACKRCGRPVVHEVYVTEYGALFHQACWRAESQLSMCAKERHGSYSE